MAITNIREAQACLKATKLDARKRSLLVDIREGGIDMKVFKLRETLGVDTFDAITLDAAHKALIAGYGSAPADYREIARIVPATDFKTRNAVALGGVANMPIVPENTEYLEATRSDVRVSYPVQKRGHIFRVSMEAMASDELNAFNQNAEDFGRSAINTVNEFALGTLFDDNPTCEYDSVALFHASSHGANLDTSSALSYTTLRVAIEVMMNQTGIQSEQIYIRPRKLMVNPARGLLATELLQSLVLQNGATTPQPGTNVLGTFLDRMPLISPHLNADTKDWYVVGNRPVIELAFLGGRDQPEILREPDNTGASFTYDAVAWKVRLVFGGDVIDHRAAYKGEE